MTNNKLELITVVKDNHRNLYDVSTHKHNHYEIVYYKSGNGNIVIGEKEYEFTPNSFSITKPGVYHREYSKNSVNLIYVGFLLEDDESIKNGVYKCPNNVHLLQILNEIQYENNLESFKKNEMMSNLLSSMIIMVKRSIQMTKGSSSEMDYVKDYIKKNIGKSINGLMIAKHFNYNYDYFRKRFKEYFTISINEFINKERTAYGLNLLKKTNLSIENISKKCGYKTTSHFISIFKSVYNTTPKQFLLNYDKNAEKK